jgi:uncharacterized membrane protein
VSLTLHAPHALWLLTLLPLVWLASWFGRTNYDARQRVWQMGVRSAMVAALALAVARPVASWGVPQRARVYLVDVSYSISSDGLHGAAAKIDALEAGRGAARSLIIVFGATVAAVTDTDALRALATSANDGGDGPVRRNGSDLAQALDAARAALPAGFTPQVVLLSDGRSTSSDLMPAIARLASAGIPVSVEPLTVRNLGDTWVDGIELPSRVAAGVPVTVRVAVGSQRESVSARVQLYDGDEVLATVTGPIAAERTALTAQVTFPVAGSRRLEARLTVADDPLAANDSLAVETVVLPRPRVLYVEGAPESAEYLAGALTEAGHAVTVARPADLVAAAAALDTWDLVVLSDLARRSIPDDTMRALARWVEHDGGGVLFAGGEAVFGEGADGAPTGYRHTELERLMPVTFERKDEPEVALVIVLDKSWSMEGGVMELCKAAAIAALDAMTAQQLIGLVSFDNEFTWEVPIRAVGDDPAEMRNRIAGIQASGATRIYPALEQAYLELEKVTARAKHVILLTDGRSYEADYAALLKNMVAARMTVSTVGVGPAADRDLLTKIAAWGMGRSYLVDDARTVQQIFVRETKDAASPAFDEALDILPVVKTRAFLGPVNLDDMPPLRGRTGMTLKDGATEILATPDGSPILAFWAVGSGRTAAFASDVKDRWATQWVGWRGYGPFFAAVSRALVRQRAPGLDLTVQTTDVEAGRRRLAVRMEARDGHGGYRAFLQPTLRVASAGGRTGDVRMRQVGPGRYEADVSAADDDALSLSVSTADGSTSPTRLVIPDPQAEYRFRPADTEMLRGIASATGGVYEPTASDLVRQPPTGQPPRRDLWPWLVTAALALWFLDIVLRRVRFGAPRELSGAVPPIAA